MIHAWIVAGWLDAGALTSVCNIPNPFEQGNTALAMRDNLKLRALYGTYPGPSPARFPSLTPFNECPDFLTRLLEFTKGATKIRLLSH